MQLPRIWVVVLNWNLRDDVIACVDSILSGRYVNQKVLVVDNASQDGSVSALRDQFGEAIDLVVNDRNLGFAGGNNAGIQRALALGADWVLLLNNDTVVAQDMVARLVDAAGRWPNAGILAPAIYHYDQPDRVWRLGDRHCRWLPIPVKVPDAELECREILPVDYVTGCGMLVRRELFQDVGLLDERFFMHYEDADLCRRARAAGYEVLCVTRARMWHKVSASSAKARPVTRYHRSRGKVLFYRQGRYGPSRLLNDLYLIGDLVCVCVCDLFCGTGFLARHAVAGFADGWRESMGRSPQAASAPHQAEGS